MNAKQIAKNILFNGDLNSKLIISNKNYIGDEPTSLPIRNKEIQISSKQIKFPKKGKLACNSKKALTLHFFANHELLAIELFAWAILSFNLTESTEKTIIKTIKEEQKHLKLYINRIEDFGHKFGEYPLNAFLWNTITKSNSFEKFYAIMALTFEQANLDFMKFYMTIFKDLGDDKTFNILNIVYLDEIKHVARGVSFLNIKKGNEELWDYYTNLLPEKITPARAKGNVFDEEGRKSSGLDNNYISSLKGYFDHFNITNRREWKRDIT